MTSLELAFPMSMAVLLMVVGIAAAFTLISFAMRMLEGTNLLFSAVSSVLLVWGLVWILQTTSQNLNDDVKDFAMATWSLVLTDQAASQVRGNVADDAVTVPATRGDNLMSVTFTIEGGKLVAYAASPGVRQP